MATERQLDANRANAQRSTGPCTEAGKSASSRNASTHSLTAKGLIILPGQEDAFAQTESGMRATLIPDGPLQEIIFTRALESAWTLHRCRLATSDLYNWVAKTKPSMDPLLDNDNEVRYSRIQRYAREAENSMYKAMRELGKLQEEASYRRQAFPLTQAQTESAELFVQTPHAISQVCSFNQVMKSIVANSRNEAKSNRIHVVAKNTPPPNESVTRNEATTAAEPLLHHAAAA